MFKLLPECIPCAFSGCLRTLRAAEASKEVELTTLKEAAHLVAEFNFASSAPALGQAIQRLVRQNTNNNDPYKKAKTFSNETMKALLPKMRQDVRKSKDPLLAAFLFSALANRIDFGPGGFSAEQLEELFFSNRQLEFGRNMYPHLKTELSRAENIVFLLDNAGEIVADSLIIEMLEKDVTAIVRGFPTINDATMDDVLEAGIEEICQFLHTGDDLPGIPQDLPKEAEAKLLNADLIISKGQGNFETMQGRGLPVFYLLMAKCCPVANCLGVKQNSLVLTTEEGF